MWPRGIKRRFDQPNNIQSFIIHTTSKVLSSIQHPKQKEDKSKTTTYSYSYVIFKNPPPRSHSSVIDAQVFVFQRGGILQQKKVAVKIAASLNDISGHHSHLRYRFCLNINLLYTIIWIYVLVSSGYIIKFFVFRQASTKPAKSLPKDKRDKRDASFWILCWPLTHCLYTKNPEYPSGYNRV